MRGRIKDNKKKGMEHQPVNIKQSNIHILDDSEEERKNILKEIIAKIFPSLLREK